MVWWLEPRGSGVVGLHSLSKKYLSELPIISQMSKSNKMAQWSRFIKKKLDTMMFRYNEVNVEARVDDHQNTSES